jgi:hypothetical protein
LKPEVNRLVEVHGLSRRDHQRAVNCLEQLVRLFAGDIAGNAEQLSDEIRRFPLSLLDDAAQSLGFERAIELLEGSDLQGLVRRIHAVEYLGGEAPFYTLSELASNAKLFADFLVMNRDYLIQTGLPPCTFDPCRWLYLHLGRLYDTRATSSPYPRTGTKEPFKWVRTPQSCTFPGRDIQECSYEDADYLQGMAPADAKRLEQDRERIFEVKLQVMKLLAAAGDGEVSTLWKAAVNVLTERFNANEIEFYFAMDRYYVNADAGSGTDRIPDQLMEPGGLTNILEVLGHHEAELTYRVFDDAKRALPTDLVERIEARDGNHKWCYLGLLATADQEHFDKAIDKMVSNAAVVATFWKGFGQRVRDAIRTDFRVLVEVEMWPKHAQALKVLVQDYADQIQTQRERGELVVAPQSKNVFRKDGDSWTIQFGTKLIAKPHSIGLFYIREILRFHDRVLEGITLRMLHTAWKIDPDDWLQKSADIVEIAWEPSGDDARDALDQPGADLGTRADDETIQACLAEKEKLVKRLARATEEGNVEAAETHKLELEQIDEYVNRSTTVLGILHGTESSRKGQMMRCGVL